MTKPMPDEALEEFRSFLKSRAGIRANRIVLTVALSLLDEVDRLRATEEAAARAANWAQHGKLCDGDSAFGDCSCGLESLARATLHLRVREPSIEVSA